MGGVLGLMLFCVCLYRRSTVAAGYKVGVGCSIGSKYLAVLAYAGDIVLVAPTASALCKRLAVYEQYASDHASVAA